MKINSMSYNDFIEDEAANMNIPYIDEPVIPEMLISDRLNKKAHLIDFMFHDLKYKGDDIVYKCTFSMRYRKELYIIEEVDIMISPFDCGKYERVRLEFRYNFEYKIHRNIFSYVPSVEREYQRIEAKVKLAAIKKSNISSNSPFTDCVIYTS